MNLNPNTRERDIPLAHMALVLLLMHLLVAFLLR